MSIDIMSAVWGSGPTNSTDRFVLLNLADRADERGHCYPSYADIAKRCAMSRPTVINAMNRLQADGWIRTEVAYKKDGSRSSNRIFISMEKLGLQPDGSKEALPRSKETLPGVVKNLDGGSKESLPKSSINRQSETSIDYAPSPEPEPTPAPSPYEAIQEHFRKRTITRPNPRRGTYDDDWRTPLTAILELTNSDPAAAIALIDRALAVARSDNEARKVYTVTCPRSLMSIAANLAAAGKVAATNGDVDTIWQQVRAALNNGFNTAPQPLQVAMKVVGWPRIKEARERDVPQLKQEVFNAYRNGAAV